MKTVNFIEAVNSGKKVNPIEYSQFFYDIEDLMNGDYTVEELVNAKYLIEERKIEITDSEFIHAFNEIAWIGTVGSLQDKNKKLHTLMKKIGF